MKKQIFLILVVFLTYLYPQSSTLDEYIKKGDSYLKENDLTLAYSSYNKALKLVEQSEYGIKKAEVYEKLGFLDFLTGQYNSALERYNTAFQIYSMLNNNDGILRIYEKVGDLYFSTNNFQNAVNLYQNGLKTLEELERTEDLNRITFKIVRCFIKTYYHDKALTNLNSLERKVTTDKDKFLINLFKGEIFIKTNQLNKGLNYLKNCEGQIKNYPEFSGRLYYYIGNYYRSIGAGNKAIKSYEKSFEGLSKNPDIEIILNNYENLGDLYFGQDRYDYAYRYYEEGKKYADKYNKSLIANFEIKKQITAAKLSYTQQAIDEIYKRIEESIESSKNIDLINYNLAQSTVFQDIGNFGSTHRYILRGIRAAKECDYSFNLGELYSRFGYAFFRLGEQDSARIYLGKAVEFLENPQNWEFPDYYIDNYKKTSEFYKYAALAFSKKPGKQNLLKAFEYSIKAKLVNYKSTFEKLFHLYNKKEIFNRYYEYLAVLNYLKKEYSLYKNSNHEDIVHIQNLEKRIKTISEKIGLEEINIRSESEFLADIVFFNKFSIPDDYLKNIPRDHAVIDYLIFDDICLMFFLKHDFISTRFFRTNDPISKPLLDYIKLTKDINVQNTQYMNESFAAFNLLLEPVMDKIDKYSNLIIIPDGVLSHLSFESIVCDTAKGFALLDSDKISSIKYTLTIPDLNYIGGEKDTKNVLLLNFEKLKQSSFHISDKLYENSIKIDDTGDLNTKKSFYSKNFDLTEINYPFENKTEPFDAAVFNTYAVFTDKKPNLTGIIIEDNVLENFMNLFTNINPTEIIFPECYFIKDDISDGNSIFSSVIAAKLAGINNITFGYKYKNRVIKSFRDIKDSNDLYYFLNSFPKKYIN